MFINIQPWGEVSMGKTLVLRTEDSAVQHYLSIYLSIYLLTIYQLRKINKQRFAKIL